MELSNSKLTAYQDCGEFYRRTYEEKEFAPATLRMHRGSAVHAVAREAHKRQKAAKESRPREPEGLVIREALPTVEEAKDLASDAFVKATDEGITYAPGEESIANSLITDAKNFAIDVSAKYVSNVAPKMNPVAVERKITVRPRDSDLVIKGVLDLVTVDDNLRIVRDIKSAEKSPNRNAADVSQQLTMYAMIDAAETGMMPDAVALDYLVRTPALHRFEHVSLESMRSPADIQALVHRLNAAKEGIEKGIFIPAQPGMSWRCSAKWCPFWRTCRYVNGS